MVAPTSWSHVAAQLGVPVLPPEKHVSRWRSSLHESTQSDCSRAFRTVSDRTTFLGYALDAAAGVASAAEGLQRDCLGEVWLRRRVCFRAAVASLDLPFRPPPGHQLEPWLAVRTLMRARLEAWEDAVQRFPEETALLRELEAEDPRVFDDLVDRAQQRGEQVDTVPRPAAVDQAFDLNTAQVFRNRWVETFGNARIRPKAPFHLAALLLGHVLKGARPAALFLEHCGMPKVRPVVAGDPDGTAALKVLDDGVHNARKSWRRLRVHDVATGNAARLCDVVELVTHELSRTERSTASPSPGAS